MPSSSRLYAVLRAGAGEARKGAEDESGLTRTLKNTSLVPTGACLPRNFDPDYCAYDRYYTLGVAVVTAVLGKLTESPVLPILATSVTDVVRNALGRYCHVMPPKEPDGIVFRSPTPKQWHRMDRDEKNDAREHFSHLCWSLDQTLREVPEMYNVQADFKNDKLTKFIMQLVVAPAALAAFLVDNLIFERLTFVHMMTSPIYAFYVAKYLSRYMNEHAMMVASFFRVNSKRIHNNEPPLTDLKAFARQCKEDIADGPNPPPPPPTAEELAAARADAEAQRLRSAEVIDEVMKMPTIMAAYE
jgi:hypothetical protein